MDLQNLDSDPNIVDQDLARTHKVLKRKDPDLKLG